MSTKKFTDRFIQSLAPEEREEYGDEQVRGLYLRVGKQGANKAFLVRCRDGSGKLRTRTLGVYPTLSLKDARDSAREVIRELKHGEDPHVRKVAGRAKHESPPLRRIVEEYQAVRAKNTEVWSRKNNRSSTAERVISCVFRHLFDRPVETITDAEVSDAMLHYKPVGRSGKKSANGQVARARAYLKTALDWCAARGMHRQRGNHRQEILDVIDLGLHRDPSVDDPAIPGERLRVLNRKELEKVLPLLRYPAPSGLGLKIPPHKDYRFVLLRFILMTGARLEEVTMARWKHIDFDHGTWEKPTVKSRRVRKRAQSLPLSRQILDLLKALPGYGGDPDALIFPNEKGNPIGNLTRFAPVLERSTGVAGWHRHDLRRTASIIMEGLGVADHTIDQILGHKAPRTRERAPATSAALRSYLVDNTFDFRGEDHHRVALGRLADFLANVEREAAVSVAR